MTTMATTSPAGVAKRDETGASRGGWGLWLGLLWLPFLWRLTPVWSATVERSYGWAVPLLALFFAVERRRWLPAPERPGRTGRAMAWSAVVVALVGLPGLFSVQEANPMWPAVQWATWAMLAAATLGGIAASGGGKMARHFAFPVVFVATALTWPAAVSTRLATELGGWNAGVAAAVVSAAGHPAVVSGNVIEVAGGWVGIDEACSGLRSLQAAAMAGLFFGELFLLGIGRRVLLLAGALAVAVVANGIRTTALTWVAASESIAASARWHDRAGGVELVATLFGIGLLAWWFGRRSRKRPADTSERWPALQRRWLLWGAAGVAAIAPVAWYGAHEASLAGTRAQWTLVQPDATWKTFEIPPLAQSLLRASSIHGLARDESGRGGRAFALVVRWDGGAGRDFAGQDHDPSICLPAAGRSMEVVATRAVGVHGVPVTFTVGAFEADGRVQHVFYCHWDAWLGRARGERTMVDIPRWRWERVREGRRRSDAAYVAFVVPAAELAEAEAWVEAWAPRLLRRD